MLSLSSFTPSLKSKITETVIKLVIKFIVSY